MSQATYRPKVPVEADDFRLIRESPDALGFDQATSESKRLGILVHEGVQARLERARRQRRMEIYAVWADDDENRRAVAAVRDSMRQEGGPLAAYGYRPVTEDDETSE
jgi:hypothetical protein